LAEAASTVAAIALNTNSNLIIRLSRSDVLDLRGAGRALLGKQRLPDRPPQGVGTGRMVR
jgi:hypothetical protein